MCPDPCSTGSSIDYDKTHLLPPPLPLSQGQFPLLFMHLGNPNCIISTDVLIEDNSSSAKLPVHI